MNDITLRDSAGTADVRTIIEPKHERYEGGRFIFISIKGRPFGAAATSTVSGTVNIGTGNSPRWSTQPRLVSEFVQLVRTIEEVQSVWYSSGDSNLYILTVLDKKPFDRSVRYQVYEAEQVLLDRYTLAMVDFRLINLAEHSPETMPSLSGSPGLTKVYDRSQDAR